jgi:hypothetical protein
MICICNQTCFIGLASIIRSKVYLNKHMQHLCFKVMFHMFQLNAILYFTCDYECKMMLMRMICNAKCMRNTGVLQLSILNVITLAKCLDHKIKKLLPLIPLSWAFYFSLSFFPSRALDQHGHTTMIFIHLLYHLKYLSTYLIYYHRTS